MDAVDDSGSFMPSWVSFFTRVTNWIVANSQYGTTAQRPTKGLQPGDKYFDTTLGFIIHVKSVGPVVWVM
jgi:hypothetical protein